MAQNGRRRDQRQPGASENNKYISSYVLVIMELFSPICLSTLYMESPSGMPSIALMNLANTFDPILKVAGASGAPTIRL